MALVHAAEFRDKVIALAKGLIARGVMPGDAVSIISSTSWQWAALDMAIMSIGSLTVPVYETNSPAQVATIFNDSQVTMAFARTMRSVTRSSPSARAAAR